MLPARARGYCREACGKSGSTMRYAYAPEDAALIGWALNILQRIGTLEKRQAEPLLAELLGHAQAV